MNARHRANMIADAVRPIARAVMVHTWEGLDLAQVEAVSDALVFVTCGPDWITVRRVGAHGDITENAFGVDRAIHCARRALARERNGAAL